MQSKNRYTLLDILRGIAVVCMVVYHILWDLVNVFDVRLLWFRSESAHIFQLGIRWAFILLSGFCLPLGKHKLKRALTVLGGAVAVGVVTAIFTPQSAIVHGVLALIGTGMLLDIPLERLFRKIPPIAGLIICALLFFITYDVEMGYLRLGELVLWRLPHVLYANTFTAFFGFAPASFSSSDYVPLLPWIFLLWAGYFLYRIFERAKMLRYLSCVSCAPLEWIGRHSLIIYMLHQPVIYAVLWLISRSRLLYL